MIIINLVLRGTDDHKTLKGNRWISYIFIKLSTRQKRLKFIILFDIIAKPVETGKVIHSPVIHSSRYFVCFFAPDTTPADRRKTDGS